MTTELDLEATHRFVRFRHTSLPRRRGVPQRGDPFKVSELAANLMRKALGGHGNDEDGVTVQTAKAAGLLIYAMDGYGLCYEEVCGYACHRVAEALRQISCDNREPEPRRIMDQHNRLLGADLCMQLVKLAELIVVFEQIVREWRADPVIFEDLDLRNWVERTKSLLAAMRRLREAPRMNHELSIFVRRVDQLVRDEEQRVTRVKAEVKASRIAALAVPAPVPAIQSPSPPVISNGKLKKHQPGALAPPALFA